MESRCPPQRSGSSTFSSKVAPIFLASHKARDAWMDHSEGGPLQGWTASDHLFSQGGKANVLQQAREFHGLFG